MLTIAMFTTNFKSGSAHCSNGNDMLFFRSVLFIVKVFPNCNTTAINLMKFKPDSADLSYSLALSLL